MLLAPMVDVVPVDLVALHGDDVAGIVAILRPIDQDRRWSFVTITSSGVGSQTCRSSA